MELEKKLSIPEIRVSFHPGKELLEMPKISSSTDSVIYLMDGFDKDTMALQEQFVVMYLNRCNRILGIYKCSVGGITETVADPRIILGIALKIASSHIIVSHNHPSCSLRPSYADEELTRKIKSAAQHFDIKLLDHVIFDPFGNYYSFAEEGLI